MVALLLALGQGALAAYAQNQNTYLVRAVAWTTAPELRDDRLVRSADPTPVFTALARFAIAVGDGPVLLHALWLVAAIAFFVALGHVAGLDQASWCERALWAGLLAVLTGTRIGLLDGTVLAKPLEGVAGQYALGPVLQPSTAGVLLLVALAMAVSRGVGPIVTAVLFSAALVHPSYLPTAWLLLIALVVAEATDRPTSEDRRRIAVPALLTGVVASVVVGAANATSYAGVLAPEAGDANRILVDERVPHHARPETWFDLRVLVVVLVVLGAGLLARRADAERIRRLGTVLLVGAAVTTGATVVVAVVGVPSLLLAFPWRASVALVPVAVSLLAAASAQAVARRASTRRVRNAITALALAGVLLSGGSGLRTTLESRSAGADDGPLVVALRELVPPGEGLIPTGRYSGAAWMSADVRINAGLPVYVDWKNNPNEPAAVLAWRSRLDAAEAAAASGPALCDLLTRERFGWVALDAAVVDAAMREGCLDGWSTRPVGDLTLAIAPT